MMPDETSPESSINIEPQYDGVIMLSSELVLFNDAKPRPDGRKIYHVFEKHNGSVTDSQSEEFSQRSEELFSQASENTVQNIHQVLGKNELVAQEWLPISNLGSVFYSKLHSQLYTSNNCTTLQDPNAYEASVATPPSTLSLLHAESQGNSNNSYQLQLGTTNSQDGITISVHCHFSPYKMHKFYSNYPADLQTHSGKRKLLRRLERRGVLTVDFEPENLSLILKTKRSAQVFIGLLKKFDPNIFLISTSCDLVFCENECSDSCLASKYVIANL